MDNHQPIYIIAPFPEGEDLRDGMMQRISVIDGILGSRSKIYVNISIKNKKFASKIHSENVKEYFFNPIFPFYIFKYFILKAKNIYSHSIHPLKYIPYFFLFSSQKFMVLDAHGVVPEEIKMYGKYSRYLYALLIERLTFRHLNHCICVTNSMISHFMNRYKKHHVNYHLYSTSRLLKPVDEGEVNSLRSQLGYSEQDVVFIYSGNTQTWQNIPLMVDAMAKLNSFKILILTGEVQKFKDAFRERNIDMSNVEIFSVDPSALNQYYALSHYGFILRDDSVVNEVANPTKMLEYLQIGITPVVLFPKIGDYFLMNYEFLELKDLNNVSIKPYRSLRNIEIAKEIAANRENFNVASLFN